MTTLSKRCVLIALAALASGAALPAAAQSGRALDFPDGRPIGEAYLAAYPTADLTSLRNEVREAEFDAEAVARLRGRALADFGAQRLFNYRGWRLSETEAQLFALLV